MAIYHLHTEPASRSTGKNAVAMAAYRSGGWLIDERTGEVKDYTKKQGILENAIFYPQGVRFNRQELWNMAEAAERRKDSRVAREIRVAIPHELEPQKRSELVKDFAQNLVKTYAVAVDMAIHEPDKQGDNRNYHAHLLLTTRQISQDGLGEKSDLEKSDKALKLDGKASTIQQIKEIRGKWEKLCNLALERQGREERISAKSYRERQIDRQPTIHVGPSAMAMERRGIKTRKVILNRAIRKRNLRRALVRKRERLRREIEQSEREILRLRQEQSQEMNRIISGHDSVLQQHIEAARESQIAQEQQNESAIARLLENTKVRLQEINKEHSQNLSVEDLLRRENEKSRKGSDLDRDGFER